jgi:hypothetical protein
MKRVHWVLIAAVAMFGGAQGCESSSDDVDAGRDAVDQPDVAEDPGVSQDPGQEDPGNVDPGTPDPGSDDPGTFDPGQEDPGGVEDPGAPACPTVLFGGTECFEIAGCVLACPEDEAFEASCMALGDDAGRAAFAALRDCLAGAEDCDAYFDGEDAADCVMSACGVEMGACLPAGTGTCRDIWTCRKDCDPEDPGCPLRCMALGTVDDRSTWSLYQRCVFQGDCASTDVLPSGWPTQNCENDIANNYCTNQWQACFPPL